MSKKESANHYIQTEGRINLTPSTYLSQVKLFLTLLSVGTIGVITISLIYQGITYQSLIISVAYILLSFVVGTHIYKHSKTASIKGDMLILNAMNKRSTVMSIRGVKKVKSKSFLGLSLTVLRYNFDGKMKMIYFVSRNIVSTPEELVKKALRLAKKKKKANHKPGSVFAQQA